jgi:hypothetical protein
MRFDRAVAGTISPPLIDSRFDRPAYYSQAFDGVEHFFDAHGVLIEEGKPAPASSKAATSEPDVQRQLSPRELIKGADTLPWSLFLKESQRVLGPECPAGKAAIVESLKKHLTVFEGKKATKGGRKPQNDAKAPPPDADAELGPEAVAETPPEPVAAGAVDLAAWGRGDKEYRFAEVRKEIRRKFGVQIAGAHERAEAVELLVKEKVISAAAAREDV